MDEMGSLKQWLAGLFSKNSNRRRSDRLRAPKLVVYYWTGAKPEKHEVRDISPTGIYVVTDERWYLGTVVKMTLQMTDSEEKTFEQHIAVESQAVRWGDDGVGMSFVMMDDASIAADKSSLLVSADRKTVESFLRQLHSDSE